jgi:GNAT superfamily N-acetyltransferase
MIVRDAESGDYEAYARLMPELRVPDPIPSREKYEESLRARMLIAAAQDGSVVGYLLYELMAEVGYIRNVVVDPARRLGGVGAALMEAARRVFEGERLQAWCLNVKPDNVAALALYGRCGLTPAYRSCAMRIPRELPPLPSPPGLTVAPLEPADEPAAETAVKLLRGQLASARAKGRMILQLQRDGALAGVAVFDPSFPGAFPFRVVDAAVGPAFLQALRERTPPDKPHLQLTVEDHDELRDALVAAGAVPFMEILHLHAPLR